MDKEKIQAEVQAMAEEYKQTKENTLKEMQSLLVTIILQTEEMPEKKEVLSCIANLLAHACNEYECLILYSMAGYERPREVLK